MRVGDGAKHQIEPVWGGDPVPSEAADRARIIPWPSNRWTMRKDSCGQNDSADPKHGLGGKKVRPDQPASPSYATASTRGRRCDHAEDDNRLCNRAPMTEDQRALAVRYIPMAQAIARRAVLLGTSEGDELQSAAYMGLVEAAMTFDPSRKVNFATYARHRIRGAIRDYRRLVLSEGWRGDPAHRPVFQTIRGDVEAYGRVLKAQDDRPVGAEIESTEAVEKWLSRLPKIQAAACRLIYLHGKSQDEAAALLGYSKSYVSRLHRDAISRLIQDFHAACESGRPGYPADHA